jgi:hypothetical protein
MTKTECVENKKVNEREERKKDTFITRCVTRCAVLT